jgi:hypothetical protein
MAAFLKRIGWLMVMGAILFAAPMVRADGTVFGNTVFSPHYRAPDGDSSCNDSSGGGSPYASYYWLAYQQWLQWQQKIYEDRRHDAEVRAEQMKQDRLDRQLYHPPVTEIWAAEPLNALLVNLQTLETKGTTLPEIDIPDDVLPHANLTSGVSAGNVGVLKNDGTLNWPMALRRAEFKSTQDELGTLAKSLVAEVKAGNIDADSYRKALALVDEAKSKLLSMRLSAPEQIQGKRYLNDLTDAIKVLSQPDAASYFNKTYAAKGHTVKTLVEYMTKKGLKFAPAGPQDKVAYLALHRALADCLLSLTNQPVIQ